MGVAALCPWHPKLRQKSQDGPADIKRVSEIWGLKAKIEPNWFMIILKLKKILLGLQGEKPLHLEVPPHTNTIVASRRKGRPAARGMGRKNCGGMTFKPNLAGYVGTCPLERRVQLKTRRRLSVHVWSYESTMQTLATSDV